MNKKTKVCHSDQGTRHGSEYEVIVKYLRGAIYVGDLTQWNLDSKKKLLEPKEKIPRMNYQS